MGSNKRTFLSLCLFGLAGCASLSGDATYTYTRQATNGDTIIVKIQSGRDLPNGGKVKIGKDGELEVEVQSLREGSSDLQSVAILAQVLAGIIRGAPNVATDPNQ